MGNGCVWNTFDGFNFQNTEVSLSSVILEKWVVIRAWIAGWFLSRDDSVEPAAKHDAIDIAGMNTESDETAGELIHHHQHPMAFETNRLTVFLLEANSLRYLRRTRHW